MRISEYPSIPYRHPSEDLLRLGILDAGPKMTVLSGGFHAWMSRGYDFKIYSKVIFHLLDSHVMMLKLDFFF